MSIKSLITPGVVCVALLSSYTASAYAIPEGCSVPAAVAGGRSFYVDPVHGSQSGDGSTARPWHTLAEVADDNFKRQGVFAHHAIRPGDVINLLTGDHGIVTLRHTLNADFITVQAVPGNTPVIAELNITGAQKWIFKGLKFQALSDQSRALVNVAAEHNGEPSHDIIFDGNTFSSQDDVTSWTQADWFTKGRKRGVILDGRGGSHCFSLTNNKFYNIQRGITMAADKTTFSNNSINNYGDDAMDYAANDQIISHNIITNNHDIADKNHNDAIQGQHGYGPSFSNILIDSNVIINQTYKALPFPGMLQGITIFDEDWANVTVTNNIVITNAYHGISLSSVHGGLIANNIVLSSWDKTTRLIVGAKTHDGALTDHMIVKNNISTTLIIVPQGVTLENNVTAQYNKMSETGKMKGIHAPGPELGQNRLALDILSYFAKFDPVNKIYDLRRKTDGILKERGGPLSVKTLPDSADVIVEQN